MSRTIELDPVARLTTGAVGEPGSRTFYIQGRKEDTLVTLLCEKQQVAALSELIDQLLARLEGGGHRDILSREPSPEHPSTSQGELELEDPLEPEFRVGQMALGYDPARDLVLLQCEEFVPGEEEEEGDEGFEEVEDLEDLLGGSEDRATVRFWATRDQMRRLSKRGVGVVAGGRPTCPMCGGPIDPAGHFCPSSNGHKETDELP